LKGFERVTEHIYRIELSYKILGMFSIPVAVWLIKHGDEWILVDSGPPEAADQLVSAIARATGGRGPNRVLLTHAHQDHSGGLTAIRLAWNSAIMCHVYEVPFVTGEIRYRDLEPQGLSFWIGRFFMRQPSEGLPVARDLQRGEAVDEMALIHLPGHSPGQIGFLHPLDRAMICGDAVMNLGDRLSAPFAIATHDPMLARGSIHRLADMDFDHLLPSHGPPILKRGREAMLEFLRGGDGDIIPTPWSADTQPR
jgi:glyoxylase-like metal-dependent hydrolase (beta-lactamase superfamily II)